MTAPNEFEPRQVFPSPPRQPRRAILLVAAAVLGAVVVLPLAASLLTDWYWFQEIGFESVFTTSVIWRTGLFVAGAVFAAGFVYLNARIAGAGLARRPMVVVTNEGPREIDVSKILPRFLAAGAAFIGLIGGATASQLWMTFVTALNGVTVGRTDSLFERDLGYYLFTLPAIEAVVTSLVALTTVSLLVSAALYAMRGALAFARDRRITPAPAVARHLAGLIAALFLLLAARLEFVSTAELLQSTTGPLVGASYTDVRVALPALHLTAVVAVIAAVLVVVGALRGQLVRYAVMGLVAFAATSVVGRGLLPYAVQKLVVVPNELARETPYLERHVAATRAAWALDSVATRDLSGEATLDLADIQANTATIENVRLWERDLVQQTFGQLQEIRTYYDFVSVTDDRYVIDGRYRQVHLAARELNSASLPTRTFINEHLTFTHGMGVTMAPVNQVTSEGLPLLFIKDLPPVSTTSVTLTRPGIYYGELTNSYIFVGTGQREFDYPAGDDNVESNYAGTGGIEIGSLFRRALYAFQFGSLKIMLSADVASDSRVLYRRNIRERARTALPFLTFDSEPFLVIDDVGQLKWMMDAYTTSTRFPYAQRTTNGINYMRNSVKVVIDAYDGSVTAYVAEPNDPIIRTYESIFAGVFTPMSEMPDGLRRHVRYPGDLFRVQAALYSTYHMNEATTFYHREDQWQFPSDAARTDRVNPFLRHIILRLPGEAEPEFIYMTPFTPRGKDNLAAWMVARMDGDRYGELVVYRFPKQSLVYGPRQVSNRINQDTEISQQITLWNQSGSTVIRGELLVIPIEESLIYVQPIYTRAEGGSIPELKRVVVAHGTSVVMNETLEQGLVQLFGGTVASGRPPAPTTPAAVQNPASMTGLSADVLRQAQQHFDRAMAAQRAGNWAEYGREIAALGALLRSGNE